MKTLHHKQLCFVAAWGREESFTVGTVEGYAEQTAREAKYSGDLCQRIHEAVERAKKHGHELAYTINPGKALTDSKGYYDRLRAEQAAATEIVAGETVMIEGRKYTVKLMGARFADPVHFIPA